MKNPESEKIHQQLVNSRSEIRRKALAEVKKLPVEEALEILVSALGEKNGDVQSDLTRAFLSYKDDALPRLVKAFHDPQWTVRKTASTIIGALGDGALARFLELIPKNEEDVDFWMVQTLSIMGGEATNYLIKAFSHSNPTIKVAAVRAAANVRDKPIVVPLLKQLESGHWPLRKAAFDSLQRVHSLDPEAVLEALRTVSPEAKYWVIQLAADRREPALIPMFCDIIKNDPEESKLEAIRALAMIETPESQKVLVGLLAHKSWIVRKTAADAIWTQGLEVSDELLLSAGAPDVDTRYWTVKVLGRANEPKVFAKLLDSLRDPHPSVRAAACQALGATGDKRALAPLMTSISDPSEEVRTQAVLAISQIGEKDETMRESPSVPAHLKGENQIACSHCGKLVGRNFAFCPFCLHHLKQPCRKCHRPLEPGWKGCPDCGEPA